MNNIVLNGVKSSVNGSNTGGGGISPVSVIQSGVKSVICGVSGGEVKPIKVNSNGELEMTAEIDSSGLATSANQTNGTQEAKCMGNDSGSQKQILVSNTGVVQTFDGEVWGKASQIANQTALSNTQEQTIIANQTNLTQTAKCMGITGGGSQQQLKVESDGSTIIGGGAVKTAISSVDSSTQHIVVDANNHLQVELPNRLGQKANASSISTCRSSTTGAYDLSARTLISGGGSSATSTKLKCNTEGTLETTSGNYNIFDFDIATATVGAGATITSSAIDLSSATTDADMLIASTQYDRDVVISLDGNVGGAAGIGFRFAYSMDNVKYITDAFNLVSSTTQTVMGTNQGVPKYPFIKLIVQNTTTSSQDLTTAKLMCR